MREISSKDLTKTAWALVADDKGLLAMDESNPTCDERFAKLGIPLNEEAWRAWRELIVTAPGLVECISGAILYDEAIRQIKRDCAPFPAVLADAGIIPGIKIDIGAKDLAGHPGVKITEGLDGLRERLAGYSKMGAPYASLCQETGLVPVVEPEVHMEGDHSLERCREIKEQVLRAIFYQLWAQGVALEGRILKPNMVLPGSTCPTQDSVDAVADATVRCLLGTIPAVVPGIAFLSSGQSCDLASARLNAMNARLEARLPWAVAFSFSRAIQRPALDFWRRDGSRAQEAQWILLHRAGRNRAARRGEYTPEMERT